MTKAEYFSQQIKKHKLMFGVFNYKYNSEKQTFCFTPWKEKDQVIFNFNENTVNYHKKNLPIQDVLPFSVKKKKDLSLVYINFGGEPVLIFESLKRFSIVETVMENISRALLNDNQHVNLDTLKKIPIPTQEQDEKNEEIPISLHREDELLELFTTIKLPISKNIIKNAKKRVKDSEFIEGFLKKESGDQTRRLYTRYIPTILVILSVLSLIGWLAGLLWVYLAYFFYSLAIIVFIYWLFTLALPTLKGADDLYYGKDSKYPQRLGIVLPLIDRYFIYRIPKKNNIFYIGLIEDLIAGKYDVKFVLSYSLMTNENVIESEFNQTIDWINSSKKASYESLRSKMNNSNFEGKIQFIISSLTGYVPDSTGLDFYRSEIHPNKDNISAYHLEQLTPNRIILGYTNTDTIFIPYCKEFWENLSKENPV